MSTEKAEANREKAAQKLREVEPYDPFKRAVDRCQRVADTYDHDAYQSAAGDLCSLLPNYKSHTIDSDASGYYVNVRLYFPNKKHR